MIDAIILARGGSKGIPKKNLKLFCGKPLIAWTILQAKLSKKINNVFVSSDSSKILNISKKYGAKVIKRPANISGDKAKSESAILHALTVIGDNQKGIVMLEPTAPLRSPHDLDECINIFIKESSKFLKKSGVMFIATLNKTLKSYLFAIIGAEYVLKWLPIGTHDW